MTSIKPATLCGLICLTLAGAAGLRAEDRMRAGLWEVISTSNGMPSGTSGNTCYTPAMVAFANQPAKTLRGSTEKLSTKRGCTITEFKMNGNSMSMAKVCGAKTSVISSTYRDDAFETGDKTTTAGKTEVIRMTGRRVGDCK